MIEYLIKTIYLEPHL